MRERKYPVLERSMTAQRLYNARQVLADATAVLAGTYVPPPARGTRADVEYQIAGLITELDDGLRRLEAADAADDHVAYYRRTFHRTVADLRAELDRPDPDVHAVAMCAMQAAWLARIWPVLSASRALRRAPASLAGVNARKKAAKDCNAARCREIARGMREPTPGKVRARYLTRWPNDPAPSVSSIARYLKTKPTR